MPGKRFEECFHAQRDGTRRPLLPYLTAGLPDSETFAELIQAADAMGVTALEIGMPYSDSIADGVVIQNSFHEALGRGVTVEDTFALIETVRPKVGCALAAMVSYSIAYRTGIKAFMERAAGAGFDGVILPDVPVEESAPMRDAAERSGLAYIGLVAPTTSPRRRAAIADGSSGFVYQIATAGTTGERASLPPSLADDVAELRRAGGLPVCVGFGISNAEQVQTVCGMCDGAIVGSAIVRRIHQAMADGLHRAALVDVVSDFLQNLVDAAGVER